MSKKTTKRRNVTGEPEAERSEADGSTKRRNVTGEPEAERSEADGSTKRRNICKILKKSLIIQKILVSIFQSNTH